MPPNNRFRHQTYLFEHLTSVPLRIQASLPSTAGAAEFAERLRQVGSALRRAGVARVYLVHGTHVGHDPFGWIRPLARFWPELAGNLRDLQLRVVDRILDDIGNYPPGFSDAFESGLIPAATPPTATPPTTDPTREAPRIPVRRFVWSSENNHIGRADAAVRLIAELLQAGIPSGSRVLLWGHSHGGNVFALITNLLAADLETRGAFFEAASPFYQSPWSGAIREPAWGVVRSALATPGNPLSHLHLDFVTFGTPVRYGWDSNGYSRLLHVIYHRPEVGLDPTHVRFPPSWSDVTTAAHGDVVQQLAVAGTNTSPGILNWGAWRADRRLHRLLQQGITHSIVFERLRTGIRLPDEGQILLVDYGPIPGTILQHIAGHAVYTKREWLLFHAEEVTRRLYAQDETHHG